MLLCRQQPRPNLDTEQLAPADPEALTAPEDAMSLEERVVAASAKVVDFGNACWVHKQFTSDIQTRQYRCPEVRALTSKQPLLSLGGIGSQPALHPSLLP